MREHLEELKLGGRPMTKLEKANKEIERLNKIIGHALGYMECANKVDITYVCKILKGEIK